MLLSPIQEVQTSRSIVEVFGGLNHNIRIKDNEFYAMKNLTSSHYPLLSPRDKRGIYEYPSGGAHSPNGIVAKDALCYVDGTTLYINNYAVTGLTLTDSPKQLISMGAYIVIMPDKKYINTLDYEDMGNIEASFTTTGTVSYELCRVDGEAYEDVYVSESAPENPENADLWIDTSDTPHILKQFSESSSMWIQIPTTYVKIKHPHIASSFSQYDGVKISGISQEITSLQDFEGQTSILYDAYHDPGDSSQQRAEGTDDFIVIVGILDTVSSQETPLTIQRRMPVLDFITESENRLWGCRYGTNVDGEVVNEIYACKLGDFKNWNVFMGLSSDSYIASCGTDGQFTGAITHLGYPLFFKENCVHKVYGNFPSNYQVQTTVCRGVQKGAGKSLAIVGETLFYKSRNGVCAYDGSLPQEISSAFGGIHYTAVDEVMTDKPRNGASAGAIGNKYYISMRSEEDQKWYLAAYDASLGAWHIEDNTRADAFCECRGDLYYIEHGTGLIKTIRGTGITDDSPIDWFAESGILGTDLPDKKYISRLLIRMSLPIESYMKIYFDYDSSGEWILAHELHGTKLKSFTIPVLPRRCDHFRVRLEGRGEVKVFSIVKTIEQGSDR